MLARDIQYLGVKTVFTVGILAEILMIFYQMFYLLRILIVLPLSTGLCEGGTDWLLFSYSSGLDVTIGIIQPWLLAMM